MERSSVLDGDACVGIDATIRTGNIYHRGTCKRQIAISPDSRTFFGIFYVQTAGNGHAAVAADIVVSIQYTAALHGDITFAKHSIVSIADIAGAFQNDGNFFSSENAGSG